MYIYINIKTSGLGAEARRYFSLLLAGLLAGSCTVSGTVGWCELAVCSQVCQAEVWGVRSAGVIGRRFNSL